MLQRSVHSGRALGRGAKHVLAPTDPHAQLQSVQPIETSDALLVHGPALTTQHDVDALITEPWSRMRELADVLIAELP
jgi:hypothetical protein